MIPPPVAVDRSELLSSSRYELLVKIGTGGSASVYIGRVSGSAGFSRLVAIKRPHPHLAHDPTVERMMTTEARLASGLNHANVVAVQDVERSDGEFLLILDYVEGASLAELLEAGALSGRELPSRVALRLALDACAGLSAVHEIEGRDGRPVGFLHRDVSPQNILVGIDGTARITDFGLAKHQSAALTKAGCLKGKLAYLAPEVIDQGAFSIQSDVFAMGVVVWEALAKRRLFRGDSWADTVRKVGLEQPPLLSSIVRSLDRRIDYVVNKALDKVASRRYSTVREFAAAIEEIASQKNLIASSSEVSAYVHSVVGEDLRRRRELIRSFTDQPTWDDMMTTQTRTSIVPIGPNPATIPHIPSAPRLPAIAPLRPHDTGLPCTSGVAWASPSDLTPTLANRPEPITPTNFAIELSESEFELDDDEESTLNRAPPEPVYQSSLRARPAPYPELMTMPAPRQSAIVRPTPAHVSGRLLQAPQQNQTPNIPQIYPRDREESQSDFNVHHRATPSTWDEEPLSAWVPQTPLPPPPSATEKKLPRPELRNQARRVGLGTMISGAALLATILLLLFTQVSQLGFDSAATQPPLKAKTVLQIVFKITKKASSRMHIITPDTLPDVTPSDRIGALSPEELPDVRR